MHEVTFNISKTQWFNFLVFTCDEQRSEGCEQYVICVLDVNVLLVVVSINKTHSLIQNALIINLCLHAGGKEYINYHCSTFKIHILFHLEHLVIAIEIFSTNQFKEILIGIQSNILFVCIVQKSFFSQIKRVSNID